MRAATVFVEGVCGNTQTVSHRGNVSRSTEVYGTCQNGIFKKMQFFIWT